jgi:hypothetical protein
MDLDLARIYGTPGQKVASAVQEEQLEKQAQAELFAKLAGDNGIDLSQLSDEQIGGLWAETFGQKLAADDEDKSKEESKEEAKKDDEEKKAAAAAELSAIQEEQQKLAFADQAGRVMAHAMVQELNSINESIAKEAGRGEQAAQAAKNLGQFAKFKGKQVGEAVKAKGEQGVQAAKNIGQYGAHVAKEHPKAMAGLAAGAGVAAGAGATHAMHKKKESSALDELAVMAALEKAAAAGFDIEEATDRIAAVATLGLGESEKIASAPAGDLNAAVDIRSLEYLEAAGYPVEWA